MKVNNRIRKPQKRRSYKKRFVIAVEGSETEPSYFNILKQIQSEYCIKCLWPTKGNDPLRVLKKLNQYLKQNKNFPNDETWIVIDKDEWTNDQLDQLFEWSESSNNFGFALSNPNFEYWLLLHFEDGTGKINSNNIINRLKRHLPNYKKRINPRDISQKQINKAITRARFQDNPPCIDWPRKLGRSTVYKLVDKIVH